MLETIYDKVTFLLTYLQYWKSERETRRRSFLRIFWEKADYDDVDAFAAFRKRVKEKMKLRKKPKDEYDRLKKMYDLRDQSIKVLQILQKMWTREEMKKRINLGDLRC